MRAQTGGQSTASPRARDFWAALETATLPDAVDNSPFIQAERDEIAKRLDEIHDFVREKFELRDDLGNVAVTPTRRGTSG